MRDVLVCTRVRVYVCAVSQAELDYYEIVHKREMMTAIGVDEDHTLRQDGNRGGGGGGEGEASGWEGNVEQFGWVNEWVVWVVLWSIYTSRQIKRMTHNS